MKFTITAAGVQHKEDGEFVTFAEALAVFKQRGKQPLTQMQQNALNGVHVAPQSAPKRRNTWDDNPPEDM